LAQTLAVSLALGASAPYIRLPESAVDREQELPPRRVYLLAAQNGFAPAATPEPMQAAPADTEQAESQSVAESAPVASNETSRQRVANSGVLAMREALGELRASAPETTALTIGHNDMDNEIPRDAPQAATLSANISRGSGGIVAGVDHDSVLGRSELRDSMPRQQGGGLARSATTVERASSARPVPKRSQEEIQEVLDRNKGAMYTLYNRELRRDAGLQGKLVMSISIAPQGNVTACSILSSELGSVALHEALIALVSRIDFGNKPGTGVVTTKLPIEFFPR
jgi:TonB family protein